VVDGGMQTELLGDKPVMLSSFKWVATKSGYNKVFDTFGDDKNPAKKHKCIYHSA